MTEISSEYPRWVCHYCAVNSGGYPRYWCCTMHEGICGWCKEKRTVTHPRNYGWPNHKGIKTAVPRRTIYREIICEADQVHRT